MITGAAPVEALSPERSEAVLAAVDRKVGHALNSDPWFQLAGLWGILKGTLWNWRAALPADGGSLVASWLGWLRVDPAKASEYLPAWLQCCSHHGYLSQPATIRAHHVWRNVCQGAGRMAPAAKKQHQGGQA